MAGRKIREENEDLPNYVMLNPKRAAMWGDEFGSGVTLTYLEPDKYFAKVPKNLDCQIIKNGLAVGKLIPLDSPKDAEKHLRAAKAYAPTKGPDDAEKERIRRALSPRDYNVAAGNVRAITDLKTLRWMRDMERLGDNTIGFARTTILEVIDEQIAFNAPKESLTVEKIEEETEE